MIFRKLLYHPIQHKNGYQNAKSAPRDNTGLEFWSLTG